MSSSATKERNSVKVTATRNTARVVLSGDMTVHNAGELRDRLVKTISEKEKVTVDVTKVTLADSSIFQLLCASRRSALRLGRQLVVKCSEEGAFLRDALEAGFHRSGKCSATEGGNLLWDSTSCSGKGE